MFFEEPRHGFFLFQPALQNTTGRNGKSLPEEFPAGFFTPRPETLHTVVPCRGRGEGNIFPVLNGGKEGGTDGGGCVFLFRFPHRRYFCAARAVTCAPAGAGGGRRRQEKLRGEVSRRAGKGGEGDDERQKRPGAWSPGLVKASQLCCSSSSLVYRHLGLGQAMCRPRARVVLMTRMGD